MPKPTKQQQIEIRRSTYRDQVPAECCGTCLHVFRSDRLETLCTAVRIRGKLETFLVTATGKCDLYEPRVK